MAVLHQTERTEEKSQLIVNVHIYFPFRDVQNYGIKKLRLPQMFNGAVTTVNVRFIINVNPVKLADLTNQDDERTEFAPLEPIDLAVQQRLARRIPTEKQ